MPAAAITSTAHCHQPVSAYGASGVVSIPAGSPAAFVPAPVLVVVAAPAFAATNDTHPAVCLPAAADPAAATNDAMHSAASPAFIEVCSAVPVVSSPLPTRPLPSLPLLPPHTAINPFRRTVSLLAAAAVAPPVLAVAPPVLAADAIVPAITSTAHCHQPVSAYGASGVVSLPAAADVAPPVLASAAARPSHYPPRGSYPRPLWTRLAECMTGVKHSFDTLCAVPSADRKGKAKEHARLALRGSLENLCNNYTIIHDELDEALAGYTAAVPWPTDEEVEHFQRLSDSIWGAVNAEESLRAATGSDRGPLGTELRAAVQTLLDVWGDASTFGSTQDVLSRVFCGESLEPSSQDLEALEAKLKRDSEDDDRWRRFQEMLIMSGLFGPRNPPVGALLEC